MLIIESLSVTYQTEQGPIYALREVSLEIRKGEILALVGESGCGKSTLGHTIAGLLPPNADVQGRVIYRGEDLLRLSEDEWNRIRGRRVGFIFQEPARALNPVLTIGHQLKEVVRTHRGYRGEELYRACLDLLSRVAIPDAEQRLRAYPHELSGGLRQRAMIAIALGGNPELLIADEPTTALDVTTQSQIVRLIKKLREDLQLTVLWITHDMGVVQELADRVAVLYAGRLMEVGPVSRVLEEPLNPYTRGLIRANPVFLPPGTLPEPIPGQAPDLHTPTIGCPFASRCPERMDACEKSFPEVLDDGDRRVVCWLYHEDG